MGAKSAVRLTLWCGAGAVLGWLVWERLTLGFGALWLVPLAWGATATGAEAGALMAGYYGGALSGSVTALTLFEGAWAGPLGWAACTTLLAAPWAIARAGRVGSRCPRLGAPLRYLAALVAASLPPLGALGMASPWIAATASFPGTGLWGLALTLPVSSFLVTLGARWRTRGTSCGEAKRTLLSGVLALVLLAPGLTLSTPHTVPPARLVAINTHNWEPAGKPALARVLRQNLRVIRMVAARIVRMPPHTTFLLPEDAVVHWSPFIAWAWWPLALKAYRHHDTVALGVYTRPEGDTEKRDGLLLMGRRAGLVTARQPMPVTEWRPFLSSGARAHWGRFGATTAFGPPAAVLVCYEQLLVWPVAEAFLGHPAPTVLIGISDHWWVQPGSPDATEARMQARTLRAWGRLYGVPVILADNRPRGTTDLATPRPSAGATRAGMRPIPTKSRQSPDKLRTSIRDLGRKSQKMCLKNGQYGQSPDKVPTNYGQAVPEGQGGRVERSYGSSAARSINYRIMAPDHPSQPHHYRSKAPQ